MAMDRCVVEYYHGRTFIALPDRLLEELDDCVALDRRARDMVSECIGTEVERTEHRQWKRGSTQWARPRGDHALCTGGEAAKPASSR
jgi:hypothetical protein